MRQLMAASEAVKSATMAWSFVIPASHHRAPRNDRLEKLSIYLSLIGAAVFSAGAGGSADGAPAFCASESGRAGCGGISVGRIPVVDGSAAGADGLVSAPGVDCNGCVACASCGLRALISAMERPAIASPAATMAEARSISIL